MVEVLQPKNEYPIISSIRTHVMKFGEVSTGSPLVLIIPGNPGAVQFYEEFMRLIHGKTGYPVWGLSHAGHSRIPSHIPWEKPNDSVFTLDGQIEHKVKFVRNHIPADTELILIGHSIGAYIVLHMMDKLPTSKCKEGMLLFPTIERMSTSPQGKRMTPLLKNYRWLFCLLAFLLNLIPVSWQLSLVNWLFEKRRLTFKSPPPDCVRKGALNLTSPYCTSNATYVAHLEMQQVVDLDVAQLERHLSKLRFYYGATDHWCPPEYYHDMVKLFPHHNKLEICQEGHRHAFIIDSSAPMAMKVSQWIEDLS